MSDPVKCVDCAHFTLKNKQGTSPMAIHGYGYCAWETRAGVYYSAVKALDCSKTKPADPQVVADRMAFLNNRGK